MATQPERRISASAALAPPPFPRLEDVVKEVVRDQTKVITAGQMTQIARMYDSRVEDWRRRSSVVQQA